MNLFKLLIILLLLQNISFGKIELTIHNKEIKTAQTLLLEIKSDSKITDVKLSLKNINIPFFENSFKENYFYALIPISYYEELGTKRIIISYIENKKRVFRGIQVKVIDGAYKSEKINVQKSKIELSAKNKKRTKHEYQQAINIYRYKSKHLKWSEDFIMPLDSAVTSNFGTKRVYNDKLRSYHSGIDFKADVGTPIVASNDGLVKLAKDRFYAGNSIIIDHGQGVYTCYFHLDKILVKKNQFVKKGEVIALSGSTGRVTGPHLHFATRVHGVLVEPTNLFSLLNSLNNLSKIKE